MDPKLFEAAASGDTDFLRQTEAHKLEYAVTPQQNTVLHIAVNSKQMEFAKQVLLICPSLLVEANTEGETPLHVAARIGSLGLTKLLINTAKTQHKDVESQEGNATRELLRMVNLEKKETALHVAVRDGHLGVVKLLMEADLGMLDLVNNADQSPLSLAVLRGFSKIALHILETSPSSPCGGTNGMNALHVAVFLKNHGTMKRLVEIRPEMIKEADISERSPLHYAAFYGDLKAVRLFLQCDSSAAYLSIKDEMSPLHVAVYRGKIDVVRELIQCCPYIWELLGEKGRTALHVAVISGEEKMAKYILEEPKLVRLINKPDKDGNTPLHLAVVYQKYTIISILARDKRVNKHAMNNDDFTARDIFQSKNPKIDCVAVEKVDYLLKGSNGLRDIQRWVGTELRERMKGEAEEKRESVSVTANEGVTGLNKSMFEAQLLVGMLIATVTFAAAFTMPGGYKSEAGPDQGMATFIDRAAFTAFVIFDTIAFCFSAVTVLLLLLSLPVYQERPNFYLLAERFLLTAMICMLLAFATGVYIMLAKSIGLAITAYVITGFVMLVLFVCWSVDPTAGGFFGLDRPSRYLRNLLYDYDII